MAAPSVKARIRQSSVRSSVTLSRNVVSSRTRNALPHVASSRPSAAPAPDSNRLSVSIWRAIRNREAPSAIRRPISWRRALARASIRFAMLAQAMSSTSATVIMMAMSGSRYRSR